MTYGSICSGIEAATVAWHPVGWRPAWFAEIDPFACAVLQYRYPEVTNLGDFTAIRRSTRAASVDLLVGGTPCQSFSVAGYRRGLDDKRGNLTLEFLGAVERLLPRWIVWENVPGVLSVDSGRTFGAILGTLAQLGYGTAYRVLDAQYFGVPQRRRRVFVVGFAGAWQAAAAVLFERDSLRRDLAARRKAKEVVAALTANGLGNCGADPKQAQAGHIIAADVVQHSVSAKWAKRTSGPSGSEYHNLVCVDIAPTLLASENQGGGDRFPGMNVDTCSSLIAFSCKDHGADAMEDVAPTLRAMEYDASHANGGGQVAIAFRCCGQDGFVPSEVSPPVISTDGGNVGAPMVFEARFARNGRGAPGVVAPPLKAQSGTSGRGDGAPLVTTWVAVRRLTPRECERLQGFPDDWTLVPGYRQKLRPEEIEEMAAYLCVPLEEAVAIGATPDGPRYKAIGNSMAVPVMRWIGQRIEYVDGVLRSAA